MFTPEEDRELERMNERLRVKQERDRLLEHPDARHLTPREAQRIFALLTEIEDTAAAVWSSSRAANEAGKGIERRLDEIREIMQERGLPGMEAPPTGEQGPETLAGTIRRVCRSTPCSSLTFVWDEGRNGLEVTAAAHGKRGRAVSSVCVTEIDFKETNNPNALLARRIGDAHGCLLDLARGEMGEKEEGKPPGKHAK